MKMIVADTSALIRLARGEVLHLLAQVVEKIYVPSAVKAECQDEITTSFLRMPCVEIHAVTATLPIGLGQGEREAISLAVEK